MDNQALLRKNNLRRLCRARKWKSADLAREVGHTYSYCRDLLEDPRKSFGEKTARNIEEKVGLPFGWLDAADEIMPAALIVQSPAAPRYYVATRWLFSPELFEAVERLAPAQLNHLENVMRAHLGMAHDAPTHPTA